MEVNSKPWYESLTIWGQIVAFIGTVLSFFNIVFAADAQQKAAEAITNVAVGWSTKDYGAILAGIMALVGIGIGTVGRTQGVQPVHFRIAYSVPLEGATAAPAKKAA